MATPPKPPTQQTRVSSALLEAKTGQFDTVTRTMFNQLPQDKQIEISQMAEADRAAATKRLYSKYQGLLKQFPGLQRERSYTVRCGIGVSNGRDPHSRERAFV